MDPGACFMVGGGGPALTARIAVECNRVLGQKSTEEERIFADPAHTASVRELDAWEHFRVFSPEISGAQSKALVDTRWVLAWQEVDGEKTIQARLVAKGYQDPDLRMGNVDIAGCVSRGSSHLQLIFLGALTKWPLRNLDIKNACLQADVFGREVYLRAPRGWNSKDARRVWKLRAPAYGLNDAPAVFHRSLRKYSANSVESLSSAGLRFEVS